MKQLISSSIKPYNENANAPIRFLKDDFINVPVGIARFEKEEPFPTEVFERAYNVQHWTILVKVVILQRGATRTFSK
jgi:hypothetical protein